MQIEALQAMERESEDLAAVKGEEKQQSSASRGLNTGYSQYQNRQQQGTRTTRCYRSMLVMLFLCGPVALCVATCRFAKQIAT
jgi:hypothetical protein